MNYFNITTTTNEELPFISIYTKPTGSGDIIPGFAHSSATYIANFNPTANTPFCSFMNITGTQPDPFPYGHNLGTMIQNPTNNPRGEYLPTEEVLAIAVSTNSTAVLNQVNFVMSKVGICLAQGNQENILNPQDIAIPTLSQVLTSGSVATPTIDNSENTITIGANTTGLTLGKLATTTNIQGNLQIAGSAGSNAQVLTSNGTTAEWQTPSGGWVGVATSNLSMGNNKILVGDGTDLNVDISNNGFKLYNQSTLSVDIGFESVTTYRNGNPTKIAQISADVGLYCFNGLDAKGIQVSNTDILIDNVAGSANQVLSKDASNVLTWATPSGGGGSWVGTATSDLNMSSFNITSTSALSVGNTGVATKLIGDVDISNNLTYGNGALRVYGATSVDTTAVSINIGTAYPNRNADFTLILTGTTASQVLTFPTAVAGYKITIYNKSNKNWTLNCAGTDLFYGNGNDPPGGLLTYRNGIPGGKCLTFFQQPSSYYLINESCSTTETYFGKLYANNNANVPINLLGNQEQLFATTTPYTMPIFANTMVSSFLVCSALSSVVYLQTFATLASLVTGYVIIIRNNTLLPITIQGNANPAVIYATGSITSAATFILPSTMTCSIKAISNQGYFVFSMY
jgi:hypothetical protein